MAKFMARRSIPNITLVMRAITGHAVGVAFIDSTENHENMHENSVKYSIGRGRGPDSVGNIQL